MEYRTFAVLHKIFSLSHENREGHKIMDEKQLNRALANLTDDNEAWMAIDQLLTEFRNHATLVALDVAVKGEDRTWQCGYAQAIGDIHRTLEKRRKE
jgi:hypothetical protein